MQALVYKQLGQAMLIEKQNLGLYSGDIPVVPTIMKDEPRLDWSGAPIDHEEFRKALAFLKWSHDTHHVEAQIRLYYNQWTCKWRTAVFPQYIISAGHTREVEDDNERKNKIIDALLADGFEEAGTGHHHSGMGAFQSGDDRLDELKRNGFHFTVGRMSDNIADFHCRATLKKVNYTADHDMINPHQWLPGLGDFKNAMAEIKKFWLDLTPASLPAFPEEWKELMIKRVEENTTTNSWMSRNPGRVWDPVLRCMVPNPERRPNIWDDGDNDASARTLEKPSERAERIRLTRTKPDFYRAGPLGIKLRRDDGKDPVIQLIVPRTATCWKLYSDHGFNTRAEYIRHVRNPKDKTEKLKSIAEEVQQEKEYVRQRQAIDARKQADAELLKKASEHAPLSLAEINKIRDMNDEEFDEWMKTQEKKDTMSQFKCYNGIAFPRHVANRGGLPDPDLEVAFQFAVKLADFRAQQLPTTGISKKELEVFMHALQKFTVDAITLVRKTEMYNDVHGGFRKNRISKTQTVGFRDLLFIWISDMMDMFSDLFDDEWMTLLLAAEGQCNQYSALNEFDFYKAMCAGLMYFQDNDRLMDDFEPDGTSPYDPQNIRSHV